MPATDGESNSATDCFGKQGNLLVEQYLTDDRLGHATQTYELLIILESWVPYALARKYVTCVDGLCMSISGMQMCRTVVDPAFPAHGQRLRNSPPPPPRADHDCCHALQPVRLCYVTNRRERQSLIAMHCRPLPNCSTSVTIIARHNHRAQLHKRNPLLCSHMTGVHPQLAALHTITCGRCTIALV
jgi:hypothetical protein